MRRNETTGHQVSRRNTVKHEVTRAVREGRLARLQPCEVCGATRDIQKHHPDYNKPLHVKYLCRMHHAALHRRERGNRRQIPKVFLCGTTALKTKRESLGLSINDLALSLGMAPSKLRALEKGAPLWYIGKARVIADYFACDIPELFESKAFTADKLPRFSSLRWGK